MATRPLRFLAIVVFVGGIIALAGCGNSNSGTKGCPLASSDATSCCPASAACPRPPSLLFADGLDGQVSVFPVAIGTGALGSPTSISGIAESLGMAVLNDAFLYASGPPPTLGDPAPVDGWSITLGTGGLTPIPGSPFTLGPLSIGTGMATGVSPQVLYVGDVARIDAFTADATGALTPIAGSPFPAGNSIFLTVDPLGRFLFGTEDAPPGSLAVYTIDPTTGALASVPGSPFPVDPASTANPRPGGIAVDSTGSFVYASLTDTSQIAAFAIASNGALTPVPGSPFSTGGTPLNLLAVKNFLYVSNGSLAGYSIDPASGVLTPFAVAPTEILAGAITTDVGGSFLYASGAAGMTTFSIDANTGALTQVGTAVPYSGATVLAYLP
jgi:6-phosphogluconolactonase